jgi:hypothetical protein
MAAPADHHSSLDPGSSRSAPRPTAPPAPTLTPTRLRPRPGSARKHWRDCSGGAAGNGCCHACSVSVSICLTPPARRAVIEVATNPGSEPERMLHRLLTLAGLTGWRPTCRSAPAMASAIPTSSSRRSGWWSRSTATSITARGKPSRPVDLWVRVDRARGPSLATADSWYRTLHRHRNLACQAEVGKNGVAHSKLSVHSLTAPAILLPRHSWLRLHHWRQVPGPTDSDGQ